MIKLKLLPALCALFLLVASCKKSSKSPAAPVTPASSTQWNFNNTTFMGVPAQWFYDSVGHLGYLSSQDATGANNLEVAFVVSGPSARPNPGTYYFVNMNGTNPPAGIPPTQICIVEVGSSANVSTSIGGTLTDTAIVFFNTADKMVVFFSNIPVTGGAKVSGTLVE